MGIALGLILIAVGAVLAFAVEADVSGLDVQVVGVIVMVVGLGVMLLDLLVWRSWEAGTVVTRTTYVEGEPYVPRRRYAYWPRRRRTIVE
ncbi:MAG: DUF6458 family protein, partial [Actinomycetota bacterium]|nr:DUF6458 family protein [Actinomycetota bacterium]